jgi:hypothetical protein
MSASPIFLIQCKTTVWQPISSDRQRQNSILMEKDLHDVASEAIRSDLEVRLDGEDSVKYELHIDVSSSDARNT